MQSVFLVRLLGLFTCSLGLPVAWNDKEKFFLVKIIAWIKNIFTDWGFTPDVNEIIQLRKKNKNSTILNFVIRVPIVSGKLSVLKWRSEIAIGNSGASIFSKLAGPFKTIDNRSCILVSKQFEITQNFDPYNVHFLTNQNYSLFHNIDTIGSYASLLSCPGLLILVSVDWDNINVPPKTYLTWLWWSRNII